MIDRHESDCGRNKYVNECDCGVANNDPHWYQRRLAILDSLEAALKKCSHYKEFTKRIESFFKDALPEYTVVAYPQKESYTPAKVSVWGGRLPALGAGPTVRPGLKFDRAVTISLYSFGKDNPETAGKTWAELFQFHIDRERTSLKEGLERMLEEDSSGIETRLLALRIKLQEVMDEATRICPEPSHDLSNAFTDLLEKSYRR